MTRVALTCALILITSALLHQDVTAGKPEILSDENEIYIQEGEELRIKCQGEGKLKFSTQRLTGNYNQSAFRVSIDKHSNTYTFIRPHAIRTDTGWYACAEDGTEIKNDDQIIHRQRDDISWIYVYVNSSEPFAVMEALYDDVVTEVGKDAVIPCRTTSPDLRVIIEINDQVVPYPENSVYDPKVGLIIKSVEQVQDQEHYTCKIDGLDPGEDWTYPMYTLLVSAAMQMPTPTINQDTIRHVVWGKDLTLECSVVVLGRTTVTLTWKAPASVPQHRLHHEKQILVHTSLTRAILKKLLTIENVHETDHGNYICAAESFSGDKRESSTLLKIWDPSYTYINVSIVGNKFSITVSKGNTAKWKITIVTYPEEYDLRWYKKDGTLINTTDVDSGSRYSHTKTEIDHFFRISDVVIDDSGEYRLDIITEFNKTSVILPLMVEAQPITTIEKTSSSYALRQSGIFFCRTSGSPAPNVTWTLIEYPNFPSKRNPVYKSPSDFHNDLIDKSDPFRLVSRLNITINMTAVVICKTCNKINCTEAREQISISDAAEVFNMVAPELITEGDDISLTCSASRLNFTNDVEWKIPNDYREPNPILEKIKVTKIQNNLTTQSVLQIFNVSMSDAGIFSCRAECKTTGYKTKNYTLNVLRSRVPQITNSNLNNTKIRLKHKEITQNMTLTCVADGMPIPRVTWYKNDELLDMSNNQYEISSDNFTFHIRFFPEKDHGRYLCRAENRLGVVEKYVDIQVEGNPHSPSNIIPISLICVLIVVIVIVITYMLRKVRREKRLRRELLEAGLMNFREGAIGSLNPDLTVDEQAELLPYDKKWEFPREQLKLGKQLGSGAFGVVMKAEARGICVEGEVTTVAVKMVRRSADPSYMKALSSELKIMIHLGRHINVVNLLGACTKTIMTKRELFVIVEYCRFGNLHNYLQRHRNSFIDQIDPATQKIDSNIGSDRLQEGRRSISSETRSPMTKYPALSFSPSDSTNSSNSNDGIQLVDYRLGQNSGGVNMSPDGGILSNNSVQPGWRSNYRGDYKEQNMKPISTQDLLCWAWQVSRGMEYLSSRNVLHGDLAARNILLADDNVVKICDFGLAKNMYKDSNYKKKGDGPLPIKWMAIESIRDRIFSTQSDVWSFGIVLWEFFTLARNPYPGMEAEKQYDRLREGYRMEKPEYATEEIYEFMLDCWRAKPSERPSFSELVEKIGNLLNEGVKMHYFNLNTPYVNMNVVASRNGESDYLTMMSAPNHTYQNLPDTTVVEIHEDSAYVSMNRAMNSYNPSSIFSPRSPGLEESYFEFPPSNQDASINPDYQNLNHQSASSITTKNSYIKPVNVQPAVKSAESIEYSKDRNQNGNDLGYCNIGINPDFSKSKDPSSANEQNSDTISKRTRLRKKSSTDSFSNPSYVIMSNNHNSKVDR